MSSMEKRLGLLIDFGCRRDLHAEDLRLLPLLYHYVLEGCQGLSADEAERAEHHLKGLELQDEFRRDRRDVWINRIIFGLLSILSWAVIAGWFWPAPESWWEQIAAIASVVLGGPGFALLAFLLVSEVRIRVALWFRAEPR